MAPRSRDLHQLAHAPLTYPEVGATAGELPPGYHHLDVRRAAGVGEDALLRGAEVVLGWEMHRRAGVTVRASRTPVVEGAVAVLRLGWGRLGVDAPVRVVRVVEEPRRRGFAYGTLPGHPETGEEEFTVELDDEGRAWVRVRAFSRPATLLARAGGPVGRGVQAAVTRRYLRAVGDGPV